jgi:hypothetical protein
LGNKIAVIIGGENKVELYGSEGVDPKVLATNFQHMKASKLKASIWWDTEMPVHVAEGTGAEMIALFQKDPRVNGSYRGEWHIEAEAIDDGLVFYGQFEVDEWKENAHFKPHGDKDFKPLSAFSNLCVLAGTRVIIAHESQSSKGELVKRGDIFLFRKEAQAKSATASMYLAKHLNDVLFGTAVKKRSTTMTCLTITQLGPEPQVTA